MSGGAGDARLCPRAEAGGIAVLVCVRLEMRVPRSGWRSSAEHEANMVRRLPYAIRPFNHCTTWASWACDRRVRCMRRALR